MRRNSTTDGLDQPAQNFCHVPGLLRDLIPREADDLPTSEGQELVAPPIALEGQSRPVCTKPVDLHDDSLFPPYEIELHLLALDSHPDVHPWEPQITAPAEPKEALLQLTARDVLSYFPSFQDGAQSPNAGSPFATGQEVAYCIHVQDAEHLRLVTSPLEGTPMEGAGRVRGTAVQGIARTTKRSESARPKER
jgi:hypothetical protein